MPEMTFREAADLAKALREFGGALGDYVDDNMDQIAQSKAIQLNELSRVILSISSEVRTAAVGLLLDETSESKEELIRAAQNARDTIRHINNVGKAIRIATGLLQLAGAVMSKNPFAVVGAIVSLRDTLSA